MHLRAKSNEYVDQVGTAFVDEFPKMVLAAIALSAFSVGGEQLFNGQTDEVKRALVKEWHLLHTQGIVPQPVPAGLRKLLNAEDL